MPVHCSVMTLEYPAFGDTVRGPELIHMDQLCPMRHACD